MNPIGKSITVLILGFAFLWIISCKERKETDQETSESETTKTTVSLEAETTMDLPAYMAEGEKVYTQHCLLCHQSNGSGVSGLNPPLKGTEYVTGDQERLLKIMLNGSNVGLVVNGSTYSNAMPAFGMLSDEEIANVTSYIRNSFGNAASAITSDVVRAIRTNTKG
ncbi:MAG: cytochrome c [Flavobacteriaceae bacterium]